MLGYDSADDPAALLVRPLDERRRRFLRRAVAASLLLAAGLAMCALLVASKEPAGNVALPPMGPAPEDPAPRVAIYDSNLRARMRAEQVPSACNPKPVNSACNPMCSACPVPRNETSLAQLVGECMVGGALAFCGYAGMATAGFPSDYEGGLGPLCAVTNARVEFAPKPNPATAQAELVGAEFVCFNSSKDNWDRLCISRQWYRSVDCIAHSPSSDSTPTKHPEPHRSSSRDSTAKPASPLASPLSGPLPLPSGTPPLPSPLVSSLSLSARKDSRPAFLAKILSAGEADYRASHRGRAPQFQCFHRGGFGSVPWLHLHSFDQHADSICPEMSTAEGASPNPLPHQIVCANGNRSVESRVLQMLEILEGYHPGDAY